MAGRVAARSLTQIAGAARAVFTTRGYRGTGISDVSRALGLSHGALYTYVQSKEALLYVALLHAIRPETVEELAVPVAAPPEREIVALAAGWADERAGFPLLTAAADGSPGPAVRAELGGVVDELYAFVETNRAVLALVEQCARELPEMFQLYFVQRRRALLELLTRFLRSRIAGGLLDPVPDEPAAARFVVETVTWFAWHRLDDPDSAMLADDTARATVHHLLLTAFVADGGRS